jgi:hypothetical protein
MYEFPDSLVTVLDIVARLQGKFLARTGYFTLLWVIQTDYVFLLGP